MRCLVLLLLLVGCATPAPEPIIVTKIVKVEVTKSCIDKPVEKPVFTADDALLAMDDYQATLEMWLDRRARMDYEALQEAQLLGCR